MVRFYTSHEFWKTFSTRNPKLKKKLEYVDVEHIDNPTLVTLAVNPKESFEVFNRKNINKKHKGLKEGAKRMEFESYAKG